MNRTFNFVVPATERGWGDNKRTLPPVAITVELQIDVDRIASELAGKLARSKGKKSNAMHGLVFAKVVSRREV